jgi:beta-lactamase superfamily II metal-dependent hydrolase
MATRKATKKTKKASSKKSDTKKSSKKPTSKNSSKKSAAASGKEVRIRMYNVGFGDAFLVLVPANGKQRRVLFDCGSIQAAQDVPMESIVDRIIADVTDDDGVPRIDVVVATHRHKDHISGFGNAKWNTVEVREVWMPWTEDPTDAKGRKIRDIQSSLALALNMSLAKPVAGLSAAELEVRNRALDIVANSLSLTNEKEMKTLHSGFLGEPERRFLPIKPKADNNGRLLKTDVLPGVKIHVLGPSRERDVIRDMDPPKGESFLRMRASIDIDTSLPPAPFAAEFRQDNYTGTGTFLLTDRDGIKKAGSQTDLAVAVALDKAVNGTSLMLMFEVAGTFFLFPGDAQWGTWNAAMQDPEWKVMMKNVAFYKIGHHGSHNATPKDFVDDLMPDGICAMASTLTRTVWPDIPRIPLLDQLEKKKVNVARSDQPNAIGKTFVLDEGVIETRIPL